jgi:hypothetical protein
MARRNRAEIELGAQDKTKAAFDAVGGRFAALQQEADRTKRRFAAAGGVLTTFLGGAAVVGVMGAFIRETRAAEQEQAQLAAVLRSTGEAAGFSRDKLNAMSEELSRASTFSAGEITSAQTRLLPYINIVGEEFPRAMQAVVDMSARMGTSLTQSAETIGRALDVPSRGMVSLQEQGFKFEKSQIELAKYLEATGRRADAQKIVLRELEATYGGAARAARDTFGGAVQALQNELSALMTGQDGSLDSVRGSIEGLVGVLQAESTKQAFATFTSLLAGVASILVQAGAESVNFGNLIGRELARATTGLAPIDALKAELQDLDRALNNSFLFRPVKYLTTNREELERMRAAVLQQIQAIDAAGGAPAGSGGGGLSPEEQARLAAEAAAREANQRRAAGEAKLAQAYLENLRRQLRAAEELSAAETVLLDIQEGRLKLVGGVTEAMVLGVALEIDARRDLTKAIEDQAKAREEEDRQMAQRLQAATAEADSVEAQNKSLREQIEEIGKTASELAELRAQRLEDAAAQEEQAIAAARLMGASEGEIAQMQRRVKLLREQAGLVRDEGKKTAQEMDDFAKNAAQNVQRYLGDQFVNIMEGNFKSIGDSFIGMINRMVAEALAADLARAMFGAAAGGKGEGWLGSAVSWFGNMLGGKAAGGGVYPGGIYPVTELGEPELLRMAGRDYLMVPDAGVVEPMGRAQGGKTVIINVSQHFGAGTDHRTTAQAAADARRALEMGARNL